MENNKRLDNLLRHIENVRDNCLLLGKRLIEQEKEHLGHSLIANGQIHDNSKFYGIEWEYLNDNRWPIPDENKELFRAAVNQHVTTNKHHPEFWGKIEEMPELYLAEFCCDCYARSQEQGTSICDWMKDVATDKFGFSTSGRVYKDIKGFLELLLEKKFK